ncbi:MAG: hypothetical protein JST04_11220 [Bdellovibrionales bacterium]|nr:hypothetical protein [Bdellovibrionales bacterium]
MKIGSVTALVGDAPKRERKENPEKRKDESEADSEAFARDAEKAAAKVNSAVEAFGADTGVAANGLSAEVVGQGPGLRVTLKDGRGAVVRQFTGEEFVRLREAAAGTNRGKLLDKKL